MALKPSECTNATIRLNNEIEKIEKRIDEQLRTSYRPSKSVVVCFGRVSDEAIIIIVEKYKKIGWYIETEKIGRQNDELTMTFSVK